MPSSLIGATVIADLMSTFETAFSARVRSCYVEGSFADGTDLATSDLDLTIVFMDQYVDEAERERAIQLAAQHAALSHIELDIKLADDAEPARGVYPALKFASECVYGED